jgi:hypothetical protein
VRRVGLVAIGLTQYFRYQIQGLVLGEARRCVGEEQLVQADRREVERREVCTLRGAFRLVLCRAEGCGPAYGDRRSVVCQHRG